MVDSIIPRPLASEKVNTIGGKRTVVKPHKKFERLRTETSVKSPFWFFSHKYASFKSKYTLLKLNLWIWSFFSLLKKVIVTIPNKHVIRSTMITPVNPKYE